jgi:hypothetical protein
MASDETLKKLGLRNSKAAVKRHEAYELSAHEKHPFSLLRIAKGKDKFVGNHYSMGVLKNEKKDTDYQYNAYGKTDDLRSARKKTREYDLLNNTTKRKIRKLRNRRTTIDIATPDERRNRRTQHERVTDALDKSKRSKRLMSMYKDDMKGAKLREKNHMIARKEKIKNIENM